MLLISYKKISGILNLIDNIDVIIHAYLLFILFSISCLSDMEPLQADIAWQYDLNQAVCYNIKLIMTR